MSCLCSRPFLHEDLVYGASFHSEGCTFFHVLWSPSASGFGLFCTIFSMPLSERIPFIWRVLGSFPSFQKNQSLRKQLTLAGLTIVITGHQDTTVQ